MRPGEFLPSSIIGVPSVIGTSSFHAFDFQHLAVLGIIAALGVFIVAVARGGNSTLRRWIRSLLGTLLIADAAAIYIQQAADHALSWKYSLPLDLCYLVLIACIIALFRPNPRLTEIAYYWGFGGVLQASLTPDLAAGFPSWDFILFFWGHGVTLLAIVFLISDREFVPRKGAVLRMMVAINIYALIVGAINALAGWNYGYLCQKPLMPSMLDFLGPWPWYLLSLEGIALVMFLLLDLPWHLSIWRRNRTDEMNAGL